MYLTGAEIVDTVGQLNYRYDDDPPPPMFIKFPIIVAEGAWPGVNKTDQASARRRSSCGCP